MRGDYLPGQKWFIIHVNKNTFGVPRTEKLFEVTLSTAALCLTYVALFNSCIVLEESKAGEGGGGGRCKVQSAGCPR